VEKGAIGAAWSKQTILDPVEAVILIAMVIVILSCNRRYAVWPLIVIACFVVPSQRIVLGGLDFTLIRLIVLMGLVRVVARGEIKGLLWNNLDTAMLAFTVLRTLMTFFIDLPGDLAFRLGGDVDIYGMYFLCRCLIRDWHDVFSAVRGFIYIGVPVAVFFLIEIITHKNVFGVFGYVPDEPDLRQGHYRAYGAFAHPIVAGVFWAAMMPMMVALAWRGRKAKWEAALGLTVAMIIIFCCASSTPYMGILFGIVGAMMFPLRWWMRPIRWGILVAFCLFQMLSSKPAWRILVDIDIVGGSTGYYRYELIDQSIKHIDQWWETGGNIDTSKWSSELIDDTNYYLVIGLTGGLPLLTVFVIMVSLAFGGVGRAWRNAGANRAVVVAAWALGVSIFIFLMSFFSVTLFGQIVGLWSMILAMVGSVMPAKSLQRSAQFRRPLGRPKKIAPNRPLVSTPLTFTNGI
jgi:hypothetical protein